MHRTLYRKWRPATFDEVCGQEPVTSVLKYEIANRTTAHAYLFCGSRGTGKTSCAKIFAKAVNCLSPRDGNPCGECEACCTVASETTTDILEIDAASNNGVDNIRDIRDSVVYAPAMLKYRVYIIDEVHMLSPSAFNALLKTLEEPPERVVFILATTEVNKLPVTVVSRCQRFDFRRLSSADITGRLSEIAEAESIVLEEPAARLIARLARGGMRDAISLLELCAGENKTVDTDRVNEAAGICPRDSVERMMNAVLTQRRAEIFDGIAQIYASSLDIVTFWQDLIGYCRDLMVVKTNERAAAYLELTDDDIASLRRYAEDVSFERLAACAEMLDSALTNLQKGTYDNRVLAEMTLIKISSRRYDDSKQELFARLGELERRIAQLESGAPAPSVHKTEAAPETSEPAARAKKKEPVKKKTAESEPVSDNAPAQPGTAHDRAPAGGSAQLEPVENWVEVTDRVSRADMINGAFLADSCAVRDTAGKRLIIRTSAFAAETLKNDEDTIRLIGRAAEEADPANAGLRIEFEEYNGEKPASSPVEDLLG